MRCSVWLLPTFCNVGLAALGGDHVFATTVITVTQTAADQSIVSAALASISALSAKLVPPPSLSSEIAAIPTNIQAAFTNPAALSSIINAFATGLPLWYQTLPADAQSYLLDIGPKALSIQPQLQSLESIAGLTIATVNATDLKSTASSTGKVNSTTRSSNSTTTASNHSAIRKTTKLTSSAPSPSMNSTGRGRESTTWSTTTTETPSSPSIDLTSTSQAPTGTVSTSGASRKIATLTVELFGVVCMLGLTVVF